MYHFWCNDQKRGRQGGKNDIKKICTVEKIAKKKQQKNIFIIKISCQQAYFVWNQNPNKLWINSKQDESIKNEELLRQVGYDYSQAWNKI